MRSPARRSALILAAALITVGCGGQHRTKLPGGAPDAENGEAGVVASEPGAPAWHIGALGAPDAIAGYASTVSVLPGRPFKLYVSTTASHFRVRAFRIGWYGGREARQVWQSAPVPGHLQAPATRIASTRTVIARWHPSLTVRTTGWRAGAYLLRLDASDGPERYVPITVRSPTTAGRVVLLEGVTTWQAYNLWGGYDLYSGPRGFDDRSFAVSFDRPYDLTGTGATWFLAFDQPAIVVAERTGLPLAYETDVDLNAHPGLLAGARTIISLGHDEYYSAAMRAALLRARGAGTNIAFLGANAMFRHIRFAPSALGPDRIEIAYKVARLDPEYGRDNAATTQNWRDSPDPRPESVITGVFYECNPVSSPYIVYDSGSWIFHGTGTHRGTSFPGLVGPEYDRVNPAVPFPRPMEVLAHSPVRCGARASYADSAYYTVPSGAGVFASGTMRWVCAMRGPLCGHGVSPAATRFVDRVTDNVLRVFAAGPAGHGHPAVDNLGAVRPVPGARFSGPTS